MSYTASDLKLVKDHQNTHRIWQLYNRLTCDVKRPPELTVTDFYTARDTEFRKTIWRQLFRHSIEHGKSTAALEWKRTVILTAILTAVKPAVKKSCV